MERITLITTITGLAFGFLGAVLGVINTWRAIFRDRMRIRVGPVWLIREVGDSMMAIEITNLSFFPVTISHAGFTLINSDQHIPLLDGLLSGGNLPKRMDARTQITIFTQVSAASNSSYARIHKAYAKTACGKKFIGTSEALKGLIREIRSKSRRRF